MALHQLPDEANRLIEERRLSTEDVVETLTEIIKQHFGPDADDLIVEHFAARRTR